VEGKGAMEGSHGGEPWRGAVGRGMVDGVGASQRSEVVGPDGYHFIGFLLGFPVTRSVFLALLYYGRC